MGVVSEKNRQGAKALSEILSNVTRIVPNSRGGYDFYGGAKGAGARFDAQLKFMGFLEP